MTKREARRFIRGYIIADTDEHGLPVIPRTADMPQDAKYRWRPFPNEGEWYYADKFTPDDTENIRRCQHER